MQSREKKQQGQNLVNASPVRVANMALVPIEDLCRSITASAPQAVLVAVRASIRLPRTESVQVHLAEAACKVVLPEESGLDWDAIRQGIRSELQEFSGFKDLLAFTEIAESLDMRRLRLVDHLIVRHEGIDLLAVTFSANGQGRCAFVELGAFRRTLHTMASTAHHARRGEPASWVVAAALGAGVGLFVSTASVCLSR